MNKETFFKVKNYLINNNILKMESFESLPEKRKKGKVFSFEEHISGMIYSLLSAQTKFKIIQSNRENIDKLFFNYDSKKILDKEYEYFLDGLEKIKCGSRVRKAQMKVLHDNINTMLEITKEYGSMDKFVTSEPILEIIKKLADSNSKYKLKQMGTALVCEYLKNVGMDCAKPDVHMKRILGCNRLGWSKLAEATNSEVYSAFESLSKETETHIADIDYFFWLYCSDGNAEICTANPKCDKCVLRTECNRNGLSNNYVDEEYTEIDKASNIDDAEDKVDEYLTNENSLFNTICEWAEKMDESGELIFSRHLCGEKYVRYCTELMSDMIPDNETKEAGWKTPHHYFYEIIVNKKSIGLQLVFNYKNISSETQNICDEIISKYDFNSKSSDGNYRFPCRLDCFKISSTTTKEEIFEKMNALYNQMKGYESFIYYKIMQ